MTTGVPFPERYVATLFVAVAVLAAACGTAAPDLSAFGGMTVRQPHGPVTAPPVPDPPSTFISFNARGCPFTPESAHGLTVDCFTLVVPMRRTRSGGGTVKLSVAKVHSTSPTPLPDPVLYLEGGPGGSALSSIDFWTHPAASFLADRDLILVDQRGTGFSEPRLTCDQLTDDVFGSVAVTYAEDCVRVLRNGGVDLGAFDTTESAADLYDLRKAMKLARWNLFGISYGTRLALWTMHLYPQGIRSAVLDSVYPPMVKAQDTIAVNFVRAVGAVAADCAAQPACDRAFPDLAGQLASAIDSLNARSRGMGDSFAENLFHVMYQARIEPDVPKIISLANKGRIGEAHDLMAGAGARARNPDEQEALPPGARSRPHMSDGLYQSVECAESTPLSTPASIREAGRSVPASIAKTFVDGSLQLMAVCGVWKVEANPLAHVDSPIPTLVLAGSYDPITPPEWARLAADHLPNSQYQLVHGSGHGVWTAGDCPKQLVRQFYDDPAAAGSDCTGAPPAFAL